MEKFDGWELEGYRLVAQIGAGSFGTVFRAYQTGIGREVAVKVIRPEFASRPAFVRRFESEAKLIARLEHPYIVPLYDYWRDPQGAYLVMRWLRGGSMRDTLQKGRLSLTAAAAVMDQIAAALAMAHRARVVHHDVKPSNLLLDEDGNAYLSDFSIARSLALPVEPLTSPERVVGSLDYLSPEQARGEGGTPQTDIYSLGVVLYEMVTGEYPFHEHSSVERLYSHINDPLPAISGVSPGTENALNDVIQKATAKNPAHRYQDVLELARAFRDAVSERDRVGSLLAEQLTSREMDILELLGEGLSNQEIADRLVISIATVKWYNQQIYSKLDVSNRVQAALRARQLDLIAGQPGGDTGDTTASTGISNLSDPENPYKGLSPFEAADRDDFFGREKLIARLLQKMAQAEEPRFLALVGPSGSGKTSLVRAALLPAIQEGRLPGSAAWFVVDMLPGTHPLDTLEVALTRVAVSAASDLQEQLRRDPRGLVRAADLILPRDGRLLLVIDQFEELFTLVDDEDDRRHLLDLVYTAVTEARSRVYVVVTLRADHYDRPLHYPHFGNLLRSRMETILPLGARDLERAIVGPAARVHVTFEAGLVALIVSEITYEAGALPLLQVALRELFERRAGRVLTHAAYRDIGRAIGALAHRAESTYQKLGPRGRELTQQLLLRLAAPGEKGPNRAFPADAGRRVPRDELLAIADDTDLMDEMIDLLARHRLLALDRDPGSRRPTVELAHEALLREWDRLRDWLDEARGDIRLHRQLARMAAEWQRAEHDDSFLLRGSRLDQFAGWAQNTPLRLTVGEQRYLDASEVARRERQAVAEARRQEELETAQRLAAAERNRAQEQAQSAQRLRRRGIYLAGTLALTVLLALAMGLFAREASRQRLNAEQQLGLTRSRELAFAAQANLEEDAELSILLALAALSETHTIEAEQMLHRAILADRLLLRLENDAETAFRVAYNPDGSQLATAGMREGGLDAVTVWDAESGGEQFTLSAPYLLEDVAFSPDGTRLATAPVATEAGPVPPLQLWDAATGRELAALNLAGDDSHPLCDDFLAPGFHSVAFSPDGRRLATYHCLDGQGGVALWDIDSGRQLVAVPDFATDWGWNPRVLFSPDGRFLAANTAGATATVWDATNGERLHVLEHGGGPGVQNVAFSPDSPLLATTGFDGFARIWDVSAGEQIRSIATGSPEVWGVAFAPDGSQLATASPDGRTRLWEVTTGRELMTLSGAADRFYSVAFHPSGDRLATADLSGATLVWDLTTVGEFFGKAGNVGFEEVLFSPNGERIAASDVMGNIKVWDVTSGRDLLSWQAHGAVIEGLAFSPDGTRLATGSGDQLVKVWDASTGELLSTFEGHADYVSSVAFSPNGNRLASGSANGMVSVWDMVSGRKVYSVSMEGSVGGLSFDTDGERLAVSRGRAPDDIVVVLLDAASGEELQALTEDDFGEGAYALAFAPDGDRLAVASLSGRVTFFDSQDGERLLSIKAHDAPIWGLAFAPDGTHLATASVDGTVKLWDTQSSLLRLTLGDFGKAVPGIAIAPEGSRLVVSSYDQTVRGFLLELDALVALARSRLTRSFTVEECRQYLQREVCPEFTS